LTAALPNQWEGNPPTIDELEKKIKNNNAQGQLTS